MVLIKEKNKKNPKFGYMQGHSKKCITKVLGKHKNNFEQKKNAHQMIQKGNKNDSKNKENVNEPFDTHSKHIANKLTKHEEIVYVLEVGSNTFKSCMGKNVRLGK